jgi:multisubunit Na+/H+ antiporter MnhB subunit
MKAGTLILLVLFWLILILITGNIPIEERVSQFYFKDSPSSSIKAANLVSSVTWDYRGYDTFGEETILFTASVAVVAIMIGGMKSARKNNK